MAEGVIMSATWRRLSKLGAGWIRKLPRPVAFLQLASQCLHLSQLVYKAVNHVAFPHKLRRLQQFFGMASKPLYTEFDALTPGISWPIEAYRHHLESI